MRIFYNICMIIYPIIGLVTTNRIINIFGLLFNNYCMLIELKITLIIIRL